ncbi:50S ribosomal protein L24 [Anaerotruncus sp. X29]|jgi:large subunit ribosomal protein L24|nr:50S ribosomal protein L24 [Anaerotruncus sp. 1XD42-93]EOS55976.1 ribosomal protein L24 [Anaerotruncus sp. G3(2012)]MCI9160251.1 50S ribosomal protein L24 [Anaerotruncus sp.]NCE75108.1 50S ribosomal protein L24 [Anaerotruncus sp. X29]RKJ85401.1 50S ribosomal protein L24 [Anaerotruncus sp. 1XD22-93]MCI9234850.1 50S ribosomal protein L24 [Anaerotruncus sp.]
MEGSKVNKLHVKKGDTVIVLSGKDKGKKGKVLEVSPKERKVIVENVNMVTKHVKPRKMGDQGGIVKAEGAMYACKVMLVCPKCGKPTRIAHKILNDGTKQRLCKNTGCGETF